MSTYAVYRVWAGCTSDELAAAGDNEFVASVHRSYDPIERDGLHFVSIEMHENSDVGIGVIVHKLGWTTEIGAENEYDPKIAERASGILDRVRNVFRNLGITVEPKLYHHLDLGE